MKTEAVSAPLRDAEPRFVRREVENAGIGVGIGDTPEGLAAVRRPGCAAAIWRRFPPPAFQNWIDGLDPEHLPHGRTTLRPQSVRAAVIDLCETRGTPGGDFRTHLADDIAELARLFCELMDARFLKLRLEAVQSNACTKFHIDAVTARLICTYRGTGTQYGIVTDGEAPKRVFTVPTGAPIVLCGTLWPQSPQPGLMHRSPPIEGTGETRLVLVVDQADGHGA